MAFLHLLQEALVFVLSGFLAFSGLLAAHIDGSLGGPSTEVAVPGTADVNPSDTPLAQIPSRYEYGGPIPRILIDHSGYQQATVLGALDEEASDTLPSPIEDAIVNVYCSYREDAERIRVTTGSGVFVDPRGIILTNAHVAQFLLLEDAGDGRNTECVIRTGSPATASYTAELLYISPAWIREHAALIDAEQPSGTGERDYALLYVSESIGGELPETFPHLPMSMEPLSKEDRGRAVTLAGYPAEVLRTDGVDADLLPTTATTTLVEIYTFSEQTPDVVALGSSPVGEQGSSGGPVIDEGGYIIGLIVTRGDTKTDGATSLRAITTSYINETIREETGFDLLSTLRGDIKYRAQVFKSALVPFLSSLLSYELDDE